MNLVKQLEAIRGKFAARRRFDEEDGGWVTTESGNKIHINGLGAVDKGSPFALAKMGKPTGVSMPKKGVKLREEKPYKLTREVRDNLAGCLSSRKDKEVVFGGFYKVKEEGSRYRTATFFNPYTGQHFTESWDSDNDQDYYDDFKSEMRDVPLNKDALWVWNRSNGVVQNGDKIQVVKGRTIPKGTEAKVEAIRPIKDKYGRKVADYAYLDNGQKINIANVKIVED